MYDRIAWLRHRLEDSLGQVAGRPWCLFLVLGALRAMVRPYWGITHDAELYALQVTNRVSKGFFDRDLFFLHGSQDSYSVFSILLSPPVSILGLKWSFFLVYTASTALLILAEIRLIGALLPAHSERPAARPADGRLAGTAALVLLAVTDLPWGGWGVFHLHESFLTPRLPAVALSLLGLEQLLRRRFLGALALMLLAMALHPLMAFGGLVLVAGTACVWKLPPKAAVAIGLTTALAAAVILLHPPLGTRLFGYLDPQWHDIVRRRNPYSFPAAWSAADWWRIAFSLGVVVAGCKYLDRYRTAVMRLVILLSLAAVVGSAATETYPYALLLQGQPYRALWLLEFLAVPLGVLVMLRLWQQGTVAARLGAAFVLCFTGRLFLPSSGTPPSVTTILAISASLLVLFALIFCRGQRRDRPGLASEGGGPRQFEWAGRVGWLGPSVLASLVATALWLSLIGAGAFCLGAWGKPSFVWLVWLIPSRCGDGIVALAAVVLIAALWSATKGLWRTGFVAAAAWVGFSGLAWFSQEDLNSWRPSTQNRADVDFVRRFIRGRWQDRHRAAVVYWPANPLHVWFDIPADSFYCWCQTAGVAFSRATAVEGQRRALLVRRFELSELRESSNPRTFWRFYAPFYQTGFQEPAPTREDLVALCNEEPLDFVVLPRTFRNLVAGSNGRVFVYDCRKIRNRSRGRSQFSPAISRMAAKT